MRIAFICLILALSARLSAQTAANWTANDCSGNSHELFSDLNSGKVAVIIWVMPCANCINEALSVQTEVQNALSGNPGKVVFYLVDDYANTNCTTLSSWCTTNGITDAIVMSSKTVSMNPYGAAGMPKVVIIGADQKVYYNKNAPAVDANGIKDGITAALAAPTGISENKQSNVLSSLAPNPSLGKTNLTISIAKSSDIKIEVVNVLGQLMTTIKQGQLSIGEHVFLINTSDWNDGTYFINIQEGNSMIQEKLIVAH